jgi:hypothetical protein
MAENVLTDLQVELLQVFFSLPESEGFLLAGGAGLVAVGLSERRTEDLDLFTTRVSVELAADALEAALLDRSWRVARIHDTPTFRRLVVTTPDDAEVLVDLARDSGPLDAATVTTFGPTYPAVELAAHKLLALFGRAALRDFIDVATVSVVFDRSELIDLARRIDAGFDENVLAEMVEMLGRYSDDEIREYGADPAELRAFFTNW